MSETREEQQRRFTEVFRRADALVASLRSHDVLGGVFRFEGAAGKVTEGDVPKDMHQRLTELMEECGCWNPREDCLDGLFWVYLQMMEWKLDVHGDGSEFVCSGLGCPHELVEKAEIQSLEDLEVVTYIMAKYGFNRENMEHLVNLPWREGLGKDEATEHIRRVFAESALIDLPLLEAPTSMDSFDEQYDVPPSPLTREPEGTAYLRLQKVLSTMSMDFVDESPSST